MKRNKLIIPLGIMAAFAALAMAVFIVRASADDLLHQAARLMADATDGHAVVTFEVQAPEKSGSGSAEVWGKKDVGPNGEPAFRIVILEANMDEADVAGSTAVSDGSQVWLYKPSENTVYVGTLEEMKERMKEHEGDFEHSNKFEDFGDYDRPDFDEDDMPETPEEAVDKLLEYFTAERAGTADIGGMNANHLRLIPIPEQMPDEVRANGGLLNIWLRVADSAPLGMEYTGGAVGYAKAVATTLELNQGVDESLFTFEIPEGAEVINLADIEPPPSMSAEEAEAAADFDVLTPEDLPGAARLEGITEMRGAVVQRYRLPEGQSFTVAQGAEDAARTAAGEGGEPVTVRGVDGTLYSDDDGTRSLLTWTEGEVTFWVGGDLTPEAAVNIANSLR